MTTKQAKWELIAAIMEACGLPPMKRIRRFKLEVSVNEEIKVEVEMLPSDGSMATLRRDFRVKAEEETAVENTQLDTPYTVRFLTPQEVNRLCRISDEVRKHDEAKRLKDVVCPDCKGTRVYRGLLAEQPCPTCCGS